VQKGTVKWFNDAKGFGFIEPEGGGADVFVHYSAIAMDGFRTLKQDAVVVYEGADGPKGLIATHVLPTNVVGNSDQISKEFNGCQRETQSARN